MHHNQGSRTHMAFHLCECACAWPGRSSAQSLFHIPRIQKVSRQCECACASPCNLGDRKLCHILGGHIHSSFFELFVVQSAAWALPCSLLALCQRLCVGEQRGAHRRHTVYCKRLPQCPGTQRTCKHCEPPNKGARLTKPQQHQHKDQKVLPCAHCFLIAGPFCPDHGDL